MSECKVLQPNPPPSVRILTQAARRPDPLRVPQIDVDRATRWPIGTAVIVTRDDGSALETVTRSGPWKICGLWSIQVDGISGAYALARVRER